MDWLKVSIQHSVLDALPTLAFWKPHWEKAPWFPVPSYITRVVPPGLKLQHCAAMFGYTWRNPLLLAEALTPTTSCQRMVLLGGSLVDAMIKLSFWSKQTSSWLLPAGLWARGKRWN